MARQVHKMTFGFLNTFGHLENIQIDDDGNWQINLQAEGAGVLLDWSCPQTFITKFYVSSRKKYT